MATQIQPAVAKVTARQVVADAGRPPDGAVDSEYLNRELSWLAFDERVLAMAENPDVPLLERAKFLAIFSTNLDEFFQVRVAGLMEQVARGVSAMSPDGLSPSEQLAAIRTRSADLVHRAHACFHDQVATGLAEGGIRFSEWDELDADDREYLVEVFRARVFPVLTPIAVDPAHPFPYISNLSLNLAVFVRDPVTRATRFARVKVPPILPRFVVLPDGERFVPLERVIAHHLQDLFPGMELLSHHTFRVTRNADLVVEEDEADDLLAAIESELTRQRFGRVVRLEIEEGMSEGTLRLLQRELRITEAETSTLRGPLDLGGLWALMDLDRPDLMWESFTPVTQPRLATMGGQAPDLFAVITERDVLVHHPYGSFTSSVEAFIDQAAHDPNVLAIKQTLYRTSGPDSPIVRSLIQAAEDGKQVVALVELKARFDEEANIEWARALEEAGAHVVYGLVGLKTHSKVALVVREEGGKVRRYAHVGTGNYNERSAKIYEDVGILTDDPGTGADLSELFNFLTGYSRQEDYRSILVAPLTLRRRLLELIEREAQAGPDGHIVMKLNALVDTGIIDALYVASRAGCRIELIVRGTCCLRPGVPGLSENITVRSIVGRYLEHSRILRFGAPGRGTDWLIGSADMMPRNLDRRVEVVVRVSSPQMTERLQEIIDQALADDVLAWSLDGDGAWHRVPNVNGNDSHLRLQQLATARAHPAAVEG